LTLFQSRFDRMIADGISVKESDVGFDGGGLMQANR
jgi:hypothetical protein